MALPDPPEGGVPSGPAGGPFQGVYLGRGAHGWAFAGPERSTLVLGPSRSGKTSSLIIPNVLLAPGPVVSASTKPDVLESTSATRTARGRALVYDPSGTVCIPAGITRIGWSPVNASRRWSDALSTSESMVRTARGLSAGGWGHGGEGHWSERAASLMAPLLHAAALDDQPMASVLSWVDRHRGDRALEILCDRVGEEHTASDLLAGILTTDGREQSGIWSTASGTLAAYRSETALASTEPPFFDARSFCKGANTLYICSAGRHQRQFAPLVVGLLSEIRDATYERAAAGASGAPVLFALDEVANIAPIPDLPALVSEGAGQGLLTLACLQDLSQARARWGRDADAFVSLFGTTVVLPGIADTMTLESLSLLGGDVDAPSPSFSTARESGWRTRRSESVSYVPRRRLPIDVIARGAPGRALAVDARNQMGWIDLTPAHRSWPWREMLVAERDRGRDGPGRYRPRERC